jgi:NAD(P)-dependent dehydrogenase (short-subunit alcohol dehydrogenase family)
MRAVFDFSDRVLLITGGANGIGAALARASAEAGATTVIADVDDGNARALADSDESGRIESVHLDVSRSDEVEQVVGELVARHGRIDGLVCAAVVQPLTRVLELDPESWHRTLAVNVDGVLWCSRAVLPTMIAQRAGSIVVFSSGIAELGKAGAAGYTTSKGAVAALARTLAREVAGTGVRVNLFRPGRIDTPQFRAANPGMSGDGLDRPEDTVGPLMFLLSEQATMTGSTLAREMSYSRSALGDRPAERVT